MNVVITGARGTVGTALTAYLKSIGHTPIAWDRERVPIDDYGAMQRFLRDVRAHVVIHLALASVPTGRPNENWLVGWHWPSELAWLTRQLVIPFVVTSTAMVFTNDAKGPFSPDHPPDATEGYGGDKARMEQRVLAQNPDAHVVRLGWQIADAPGSNNMIDFFDRNQREHGRIRASRMWYPATSLVADTAAALWRAAGWSRGGILHVDSNRGDTFFDIATALNKRHGNCWVIEPSEDFVYDQRMPDPRFPMPALRDHLPELRG